MTITKSNAKFVVELDGGVEGPMLGSEVCDLALAGKVTPQTNIASFKGTDAKLQWVPAERVKGTETNRSPVIKEPAEVPANYNEPIREMG